MSDSINKKKTKSVEELQREREQAAQQLEQILNQTRPKGLGQGVTTGVNNILKGAVGAVGFAVLGPTLGLAVGLQNGGILGGAIGAAGGAIAGVLGAAAMAVGGVLSGVSQIARGIIATPESIAAPHQGKWWNEFEGKWVKTSLPEEEASVLKDVPEDDRDILGGIQKEIDQSTTELGSGKDNKTVVDPFYYECLEVPSNAEPSAIKRKYYLLARKYHPDKNPGDQAAADKFKDIAEAYQVLSDPVLRTKYDKEGRKGLSADKTSTAESGKPDLDPLILFAFLFGSDKFQDYIGRLSTATSASIGDSPKVSLMDARKIQKRRVTRLALKLAAKIDPWVTLKAMSDKNDNEAELAVIEEEWKQEAIELSNASYGYQLVTTIGQLYNLLAVMYEGSMESGQGLPSLSKWAANRQAALEKSSAANKNQRNRLKAGMAMMKAQMELQQKLAQAKTEEEKEELIKKMQEKTSEITLQVLWTTAVVDMTSAIHETTQMVFFDQSVDQDKRKFRAKAVKTLGQIWMDCPEPSNAEEKDVKTLYEEAAFAAMLETVKRRDEAAYEAE